MVNSDDKERLESIFFEARKRTSDERTSYLDEACRGNIDLRAAVVELLNADGPGDNFFDKPALGETIDSSRTEFEGLVIGRYKLLQLIGEGGFGVVYMADQTGPLRRKVAIKIIKPGMDSKEVVARFEAERQALAMMDHPNIAKVLDAGATDSGLPYFVMELVKGVSITEYCDTNQLSTSARLRVFRDVCLAIQHAHQKGVIHRDLKPTNVMVTLHDGQPVPKVIDFGVAKALNPQLTEKTLFTRYGQVVGTPQYMSPEQAEMSGLDVDTRSDIYSLGVLLYELLTGNTPLDTETIRNVGFDAMRRMICEQEPAKPSNRILTLDQATATSVASHRSTQLAALGRAVEGDLDWIVMKTLEKDRNRRYESAYGLLQDIERHLNNEPVEAGPPGLRYRLSKLYGRHRQVALAGAIVCISVLLGLFTTTLAWLKASQERHVAIMAQHGEAKQREIAEENQQQALASERRARRAASRAEETSRVLRSLIAEATPNAEDGRNSTVRDFLDGFISKLNRNPLQDRRVEVDVRMTVAAASDRFESPNTVAQLEAIESLALRAFVEHDKEYAELLLDLARLQNRQRINSSQAASTKRAMPLLMTALDIARNGDADVRLQAEVLTELSTCVGKEAAAEHLKQACALVESLGPEAIRGLTTNPYAQRCALAVATEEGLAPLLQKATRLSEQMEDVNARIDTELTLSRAKASSPDQRAVHAERAIEMAEQAKSGPALLLALGRRIQIEYSRRLPHSQSQQSIARRLKAILDRNWEELARENSKPLVGDMAGLLFAAGDPVAAMETVKLLRGEPLHHHGRLAEWMLRAGFLQEADFHYGAVSDEDPGTDAWRYSPKARSRYGARNFAGAEVYLRRGIRFCDRHEDHWAGAWYRLELALLLRSMNRSEEAKPLFAEHIALTDKNPVSMFGKGTPALRLLSALFDSTGYQSNRQLILDGEKAIQKIASGASSQDDNGAYFIHAALGELARQRGDLEAAAKEYLFAMEKRPGYDAYLPLDWINDGCVEMLTNLRDFDQLERGLRADIARRDNQVSEIHPQRAFTRIRLVEVLVANERQLDDAMEFLSEAKKIYDFHGDWIPPSEHEKLTELMTVVDVRQNTKVEE